MIKIYLDLVTCLDGRSRVVRTVAAHCQMRIGFRGPGGDSSNIVNYAVL